MSLVEVYQRIPRWASRRGGRQTRRDGRDGASSAIGTPLTVLGATLVAWYRSDLGVTLVQGPVIATGTTPPAVTMTGTPASSTNTIVITITLPGVVGVAQFSWSLNGVTQQTGQTVTSSFVLGATGITANFAAGTYNTVSTPDTYTSVVTVSSWADQSGHGFTATQATALQQFAYSPTGGPNSTPVMVGNSANVTNMTAAIGTLTRPTWVWMVCKFNSGTSSYILDGGSVNTLVFRLINASQLSIYSGTTLSTGTVTTTTFQAYGLTFGSSGSIFSNAVSESSGTTGTTSSTNLTIGGVGGGSGSVDCSIAEVVIASTPPAANALSAYSQSRYGFG